MGAVEELLASGRLDGSDTFQLLCSSFNDEARKLPALAPHGAWTHNDLDDMFGDFIVAKLPALTDGLVAAATTERALRAQARTIAKNWLIDRLRTADDAGSVRHTLEQLLAADQRFVRSPGLPHHWTLTGVTGISTAPISDLVVAARAVCDVSPGRPAGVNRRASLAPLDDLARIAEAVLTRASGAIEIALLTQVMLIRFNVFASEEVSYDDEVLVGNASPAADLSLPWERAQEVDRVMAILTDQEIQMLPLLDNQKEIQIELGVRKSQASLLNSRLRVVLAGLAPDVDDPHGFVADLVAAATQRRNKVRSLRDGIWRRGRTWRNTRLSAVLLLSHLQPWSAFDAIPELWVNPAATHPNVPILPYWAVHRVVEERRRGYSAVDPPSLAAPVFWSQQTSFKPVDSSSRERSA